MDFDDVAARLLDFIQRQDARDVAWAAYVEGTINGGPNGDGRYPLPIGNNVTSLVKCPARMDFDARRVPRIRLAGSNTVTIDPAVHQGALLEIVGGQSGSNVTVNIPQNIPEEFSCMFAAQGSGRLIFDIVGDGTLRHDQNYDRTRGQGSIAGIYVASRDSSGRPTVYLYGSLAVA